MTCDEGANNNIIKIRYLIVFCKASHANLPKILVLRWSLMSLKAFSIKGTFCQVKAFKTKLFSNLPYSVTLIASWVIFEHCCKYKHMEKFI